FSTLLERACLQPGVQAIGAIDDLPGSDDVHGSGLHFPDRPEPRPGDVPIIFHNIVAGDYFRAMRIPLLHGRYLSDRDTADSPRVAVVDEWTAKTYWPNQDAVGKRFSLGPKAPPVEIVGVVGTIERGMISLALSSHMAQTYFPAS